MSAPNLADELHAERCTAHRWYDVYRDRGVPFGPGEWLGRIQAKTRALAEADAEKQFGGEILVTLAYGSKKQAAQPLAERLAHKRSGRAPHRRKKP